MATAVEDVTASIEAVKTKIAELKGAGADKVTLKPHIVSISKLTLTTHHRRQYSEALTSWHCNRWYPFRTWTATEIIALCCSWWIIICVCICNMGWDCRHVAAS